MPQENGKKLIGENHEKITNDLLLDPDIRLDGLGI